MDTDKSLEELEAYRDYSQQVLHKLDDLGYMGYILGYRLEDVSRTVFGAIHTAWKAGWSVNLAALIIFGNTWEKLKYKINVEDQWAVH